MKTQTATVEYGSSEKSFETRKMNICEPDNGHKKDINDLETELGRLKTFDDWRNDVVTPVELAKAGFYFTKTNYDLVKCPFCNIELCRWAEGDEPIEEHLKWSPNCSFLKKKGVQQVSVPTSFSMLRPGQDIRKIFPMSEYTNFKSRLKTFVNWPKSLRQKPAELAEAGFYYIDWGDYTFCFHCGMGLKDWEDNDVPWEQHALWSPKCQFLISCKGQEFIDEVKSRLKPKDNSAPSITNLPTSEESKENKIECKNCHNNEVEVVFIPCGHFIACKKCSSLLNECPVCRKPVKEAMRVFPS